MGVAASRNECFLRNNGIVAHCHEVLIVNPRSFTYPGAVAHGQLPRELDSGPRTEYHSIANSCPKQSQYSNSEPGTDLPWIAYEYELKDCPNIHNPLWSSP